MKSKIIACATALAIMSGPALAGGMAEPIMEQEPVIEQASSSSAGIVVPLLLLLLIAAAASSGSGGATGR
ncbi:hypothetical protein OEW28_10950 [Defluviimonas sp. WL0002]|uniref:Ferrochelatase n=1 Tax=Albidovulum marisflavi TaxID=2984159 RepID=A0ABT2ZDF4_9RHOB|nr:hypothetical protein [Defluviimonas sp. WL0002]MCV2869144.1 hypothetical protein [Defluviimonas sp. WL0002]